MTLQLPTNPTIRVRNPDTVRKWIKYMNVNLGITFRQIQRKPYFSKMPIGTICAVMHGYEMPNKHREEAGLPLLVKVPEDMVRKTKPVADSPRNLTRCTFYPGTPTAKIISDLKRVTGKTFILDNKHELPIIQKGSTTNKLGF